MTANDLLPAIRSLQHGEKFRLMAVLLGELARDEGLSLEDAQLAEGAVDALKLFAEMAAPIGPADLARNFDRHTGRLVDDGTSQ